MKALSQHLKEGTRPQDNTHTKKKKKKETKGKEISLHKYLNELVEMTTHILVGRYP